MLSRTTLCHLADWQSITVSQCVETQKTVTPKDCFGCDACSRLCAECKKGHPVCPELDLCASCIQTALVKESAPENTAASAAYEWQVCVLCSKKRAHYQVYGLCLHCAARFFAGITQDTKTPLVPPAPKSNGHANLATLVAGLSDLQQIIVVLHRRDAYPMHKIGQVLGLSEGTVSQIYSEASQKIEGH